jgi:hypothetical protein
MAQAILTSSSTTKTRMPPPPLWVIPGCSYSVIAALEPGRTSWTAVPDEIRLGPDDDEAEVTAAQVRDVMPRLITAGH